jgi:sulfite reductase (ferredoxin)
MSYKLPQTLSGDISRFAALADDYENKRIEPVQFKAFRVPMGVYEQRRDEVYMARIRTTGGLIYPSQFLALIDTALAARSDAAISRSDLLHITTRQEIQIQNLHLDDIEDIMRELQSAGLSSKGGGGNTVRNIMVSEFSGLTAEETFDCTPYSIELTTKVIAEPDSFLLPRKLKIAFSSNEGQIGYAAVNDIGLVAVLRNNVRGFRVFIGGGGGTKPSVGWLLTDFLPAEELFVLVDAVKKFFSEHGNRKNKNKARLRFVFYRLGEHETLRLIREYFEEAKKTNPLLRVQEFDNERPEYFYKPENATQPEEYALWRRRYVTPQKQAGYNSILVPVALGNIPLDDTAQVAGLRRLLTFISVFGQHTIRFTTTQNIRLRNIPDEALPELFGILSEFVADLTVPLTVNNITSCTGADTCRLGICLSKELSKAIRRELLRAAELDLDRLADVRIQISGCPNSCGQQFYADLGFAGKILRNDRPYPSYQVYIGANRDTAPRLAEAVGNISARDVPQFVRRLFESYLQNDGKTSFSSYLVTAGREVALRLLDEYAGIPSFADDKNYYFDWGAEQIFSVVGRGTPECSAGLFDMIDVDLNAINSRRTLLKDESKPETRRQLLREILYSTARMLLVTRGAEPKTTAEVFNMFISNFIEAGLVDANYKDIITFAADKDDFDFTSHETEIFQLADAVIELYANMDDSLQFKKKTTESTKSTELKELTATRRKDLRGVACPMNFVQTKILLAGIQSGETLEIWLDDGAPINNVPGSVRNEGHEVLREERTGEYWTVIIKKK